MTPKRLSILFVCLIGAGTFLVLFYFGGFKSLGKKELIQHLSFIKKPSNQVSLDMIYIMGGDGISLNQGFKKAAEYYKNKECKNVWTLKRQGITHYSPSLKRNLKKNEWVVILLKKYGVPEENISFIETPDRFFGTLSEAETISELIYNKHFSNVLIITQLHHTKRTYLSFKKFFINSENSLYIVGSSEHVSLTEYIIETIKFMIYKAFLV